MHGCQVACSLSNTSGACNLAYLKPFNSHLAIRSIQTNIFYRITSILLSFLFSKTLELQTFEHCMETAHRSNRVVGSNYKHSKKTPKLLWSQIYFPFEAAAAGCILGVQGSTLIQDTKNKTLFSCTTLGSFSSHENKQKTVLEGSPFGISNLPNHLKCWIRNYYNLSDTGQFCIKKIIPEPSAILWLTWGW